MNKPPPEPLRLARPLRGLRLANPGLDPARLAELEQAAFLRGQIAGEQALSEQLLQQRAELIQLQNGVLQSLRDALPATIQDCESALVALAFEVAQKLVAELPITADTVAAAIREALNQAHEAGECWVQLHPEDLALLERTNAPQALPNGATERLHFESSPAITRGGCLVKTRFGTVDARRETKLDLLKKSLLP